MRIFEGGDEFMYGTGEGFMGGQTRENVVMGGKSDGFPLSHPARSTGSCSRRGQL